MLIVPINNYNTSSSKKISFRMKSDKIIGNAGELLNSLKAGQDLSTRQLDLINEFYAHAKKIIRIFDDKIPYKETPKAKIGSYKVGESEIVQIDMKENNHSNPFAQKVSADKAPSDLKYSFSFGFDDSYLFKFDNNNGSLKKIEHDTCAGDLLIGASITGNKVTETYVL